MHPSYWRIAVDWASAQPHRDTPPVFDSPVDGCMRGRPPCAPYAGIRDELRALASAQRAGRDVQAVVLLYGTPSWAAVNPDGCERPGTTARSRPIRDDALPAYRTFVRALLDLAQKEGVALPWWSPWNEPNHPTFISPQRRRCRTSSRALAPAVYARLVRALAAELRAEPGDQQIVLGDLAGFAGPHRYGAGVKEFVAALPADVLCAGPVWAQHAYAGSGEGGPGSVEQLERALDARGGCAARARIWVTETGAGAPHAGQQRSTSRAALRASCRAMASALEGWDRDPRVDAAFQYTFREDPAFPVGLMNAGLRRVYPVYDVWQAYGARRAGAPAPAVPASCAER
jgi:hypothetical protein